MKTASAERENENKKCKKNKSVSLKRLTVDCGGAHNFFAMGFISIYNCLSLKKKQDTIRKTRQYLQHITKEPFDVLSMA